MQTVRELARAAQCGVQGLCEYFALWHAADLLRLLLLVLSAPPILVSAPPILVTTPATLLLPPLDHIRAAPPSHGCAVAAREDRT